MKLIMLSGIIAVLTFQLPRKVKNSFNYNFQETENIHWYMEGNDYHISFEHYGRHKIAVFKVDGALIKTSVSLEIANLMFCIRDFIKQNYKNTKIGDAYYVITPTTCEYHIYLEREQNGIICIEEKPLIFDENCEFVADLP